MNKSTKNERGFAPIVAIFAAVLLFGILGYVGYKYYDKNKATDNTATNNLEQSPSATTYFVIEKWGVRAPNTSEDTFSYTLSSGDKLATVASKKLAAKDAACADFGAGVIRRLAPGDGTYPDGDGPSAEQAAKQNPDSYSYVGGYYYRFSHDQSVCGSISVSDQNQANDAVKALVSKFQAIPE